MLARTPCAPQLLQALMATLRLYDAPRRYGDEEPPPDKPEAWLRWRGGRGALEQRRELRLVERATALPAGLGAVPPLLAMLEPSVGATMRRGAGHCRRHWSWAHSCGAPSIRAADG